MDQLEFFREGGSEKHLRDIAGILKLREAELDMEYLIHQARELQVEQEWNLARSRFRSS